MSNIGLNMAAGSKLEKPLEIVFRPDQAVGIVYLRNPRNPSPEVEYLRQALPGVDVRRAALFTNASSRVDPKVDVLLLKLPEAALREVTEFAVKNKIARHEALVLLVKSGPAGTAPRVRATRQIEGPVHGERRGGEVRRPPERYPRHTALHTVRWDERKTERASKRSTAVDPDTHAIAARMIEDKIRDEWVKLGGTAISV